MANQKVKSGKSRADLGVWHTLVVIVGLILWTASGTLAGVVLQQSVQVNKTTKDATFSLWFDHTPNFLTTDSDGRQVNSFQYEVNGTWQPGQSPLGNTTGVVRGDEIHFAGDLPIRAAGPPDPADRSGGWGPIVDAVPVSVNGNKVTFTAPLSALGVTGETFSYRAFTMANGQITAQAQGETVSLPSALSVVLLMAAVAGAFVGLRTMTIQKVARIRVSSFHAPSPVQSYWRFRL